MPAGVVRIRNQFRFHVLAICDQPGLIQNVLYPHLPALSRALHAELVADADPINLV